ncbi:MAG: hypothetical protein ABH868_01680 [bacterium]
MAQLAIKDWELNIKIRAEFVRHWIDVQRVDISTTRGVAHVKGKLLFKGGKVDTKSELAVAKQLKSTERGVRSILGLRDIKFKFDGWEKSGGNWKKLHGKQAGGD